MNQIPATSKLKLETPKEGMVALTAHFKNDFVAGATISLIALPLCLGIAAAANLPPIAGLFTAIIGGLLTSRFAGAHMVISGPAAGLIVANLTAVETLGGAAPDPTCSASSACAHYAAGYPHALGAMMVASLIIILFGIFKAGKLGDLFPSAVIHGMLASIGIIIIVKQLFVALGTKELIAKEITEWKHNGGFELGLVGDFMHIPDAFAHLYGPATIIGAVAIAIIIIHPFIQVKAIQSIPSALWVLVATIPLGKVLGLTTPKSFSFGDIDFQQFFLVKLPPSIMDGVVHPSFDKISESTFWIVVLTIALITSIESLLSEVAVDTLDPYKRRTDLNKGLFSNGAGSLVASTIGGIPMISEIVRSSANIASGAKTQWANFWHGGFLLLFLLVGKPVIDMIPSAALAGILMTVGFKLTSPKQFAHAMEVGKEQLFLFVLTMVAVLCSDLLIGVAIGIAAQLAIHLHNGTHILNVFKPEISGVATANGALIKIRGSAIFSNYLGIKNHIMKTVNDTKAKIITLDFKEAMLVDHSVIISLRNLKNLLVDSGKILNIVNMDYMVPATGHPLATRDRLIDKRRLPVNQINHQYMSDPAELFEWSIMTGKQVSHDVFLDQKAETDSSIAESLQEGDVFYGVEGNTREAILVEILRRTQLPDDVDREFLSQVILKRKALRVVGVGDGIAIPHIRGPIILHVPRPMITLCFLKNPVDFGVFEGPPMTALFTLICPTVHTHLHLISRLRFALQDPAFKSAVIRQASREELIEIVEQQDVICNQDKQRHMLANFPEKSS